jgi:hypothetical protein
MKKVCGLCGTQYTGRRKLEHIKRSHRPEAYDQFISIHIDTMNKICQVCQNTRPLAEDIKLHVSRKHLGKAAKEFAQTF